jgi:transcriptional regulator with XRE-family HTH domain
VVIGERIRQRRTEANLSAAELARRAEVTKGYISQIENGQVPRPSADVLFRIAVTLGTTVADLLGKEVQPVGKQIPLSLQQFIDQHDLPVEDIEMLAAIKFRNRQPESAEDWHYLYESIKRTIRE